MAQDSEVRLAATPRAGFLHVGAFQGESSVFAGGVGTSLEWYASDAVRIGGEAVYMTRLDAPISGARMGKVGGEGFTVFAHVHDIELVGTARLVADRWLSKDFLRWHPYVGLRGGLAARLLQSPQLFNSRGAPTGQQAGQFSLFPVLGVDAGIAYRWSASVEVGASLQATYSGDDRRVITSSFDIAWLFF